MYFVASFSDLYRYMHWWVQFVFLVVIHFACGTGKTLLVSEWEQ